MAAGGWPLPDGPSPLLRTQAVSGVRRRGAPGGRKLLQVRPGCGVVRGGRVTGGNGVPWERAVASTVTIALLLINTIRASRQNPQISLSNYPHGRQMSLLQGAWTCSPVSLQAMTLPRQFKLWALRRTWDPPNSWDPIEWDPASSS